MEMEERYSSRLLVCGSFICQSAVTSTGNIAWKRIRQPRWDNRHGSIHFWKDGTVDALLQFQSLPDVIVVHLLDQQFQIPCSWQEKFVHYLV
jgi:hypothetical protein